MWLYLQIFYKTHARHTVHDDMYSQRLNKIIIVTPGEQERLMGVGKRLKTQY